LSAAAGGSSRQQEADAEEQQFVSYVALPDNKAIELRVLEKKKQDLLAKYATEAFRSQQDEAKSLLNKK
jgi:pre-mRNA-splicing factor ISY1